MNRTTLLAIMLLFLVYAVFRAVVYFRTKRPAFGIAVSFVIAIVLYEIVRTILFMMSDQS